MKTVLTLVLFAVSFCSAQQPVATAGPDVEAELTRRYADQTLLLRHAIQSDVQTYDAAGKLLTPGEEGPWTLYAGLHTTRISVDARELRIEGDRILFLYDKTERMMVPERSKEPLQVDIQLAGPLTAADDAVPLMQSVFAMSTDELIKSEPEFWSFYLTKEAGNARATRQLGLPAHKRKHFRPDNSGKWKKFRIDGKNVLPPEATFTPDPSYTQIAGTGGCRARW